MGYNKIYRNISCLVAAQAQARQWGGARTVSERRTHAEGDSMMADDAPFEEAGVHFQAEEDVGWGPWGPGPGGPGGPWGGPGWHGHGRRGPWGRGGPFGRKFGWGFGPGFGGPFGGFGPEGGPERKALMGVGFDVLRLVQASVLASGGDTTRLAQLRGILEHTRDELNAFLGQPKTGAGQSPAAGGAPMGEGPGSIL
jgi:hypothetical protein